MSKHTRHNVLIINKIELHARSASKLVQLSQKFTAKVIIRLDENRADTNIIMGLYQLH
ncbi:MAG: phosphotransferase system HPr (HPr) family protein [Cognaticolwellia sp.]|jgi:phosphotransferase system HPr (HPr) family protein